eukprot:XP_011680046.1 PREDICTED: complement component C1q receptor-like [Strongylocentrotus purpuratus]
MDECLTRDNGCSHECRNEEGSFHCNCPTGYYLDGLNGTTCLSVCQSKFSSLSKVNLTQNGTTCEFHADFDESPFGNTTSALECRPRDSLMTSGSEWSGRAATSTSTRNKRSSENHRRRWISWSPPVTSPDPTPMVVVEEDGSAICSTAIAFSNGEVWKEHESSLFRSLGVGKKSYEDTVSAEMTTLYSVIKEKKSSPFDPSTLFMQAVSNIICSIVFGTQYTYDDDAFTEVS